MNEEDSAFSRRLAETLQRSHGENRAGEYHEIAICVARIIQRLCARDGRIITLELAHRMFLYAPHILDIVVEGLRFSEH